MSHAALRAFAVLALAAIGMPWLADPATAQSWTNRPIRVIVPFPPGGTTDQIIRRIQPLLEADLKTTIVIENRSGASGSIGTQVAVTADPDGTTFLLVFDTHGVNPSLLPNLPFDTLKDLAPIMLIGKSASHLGQIFCIRVQHEPGENACARCGFFSATAGEPSGLPTCVQCLRRE